MTKEEQSIVLKDTSPRPSRYNLFKIPGSFFNGDEWHSYKVFEQDGFNGHNDNPNALVEQGRAFIVPFSEVEFTENTNDEINFIQNNG